MVHRLRAAATSQREIKFREGQEAFPNEIWERGEGALIIARGDFLLRAREGEVDEERGSKECEQEEDGNGFFRHD